MLFLFLKIAIFRKSFLSLPKKKKKKKKKLFCLQEMKKIGEELKAKSFKTATSKTNKKQKETQR